jgi:dihydrofolate reductase
MRKIILYIAASIDNYIAKSDGNVDWLDNPDYDLEGEDYGYAAFYESIDTTLMGNATYQWVLGFDIPFPYPDKKNYVFSRSKKDANDDFVTFVSGDIVGFIEKLKANSGKDIWLVGGGKINTVFLENGLIDQIILTIIPITLGDGIPLFQKGLVETKFALEKSQSFKNGMVQLTFNKK